MVLRSTQTVEVKKNKHLSGSGMDDLPWSRNGQEHVSLTACCHWGDLDSERWHESQLTVNRVAHDFRRRKSA